MTRRVKDIRILIVDDHEMVRVGLRTILTGAGGMAIVGEAGSVAEAISAARSVHPDVVLMDVRLPDGSGTEVCREIRSADPDVKVLMLTSFADQDAVLSAILAGAAGYLLKQAKAQVLIDAIATIHSGGSLLDPGVTVQLMERIRTRALDPQPHARFAALSEQERRVLELIAQGQTNQGIAKALVLSEHTVKTHVSELLSKLSLRRRSEAAAFFGRHLQPPSD
jgi:two-component system, NarL family, response regulator DevR